MNADIDALNAPCEPGQSPGSLGQPMGVLEQSGGAGARPGEAIERMQACTLRSILRRWWRRFGRVLQLRRRASRGPADDRRWLPGDGRRDAGVDLHMPRFTGAALRISG